MAEDERCLLCPSLDVVVGEVGASQKLRLQVDEFLVYLVAILDDVLEFFL